MPATRKAVCEFYFHLARHTRATPGQCQRLLRYAATLQRLAEQDCNVGLTAREKCKRIRIEDRVTEICNDIAQERYDVIRNSCTIATNLTLADAQDLRDSHLERDPETDCQIVNTGVVPVFSGDPRGAVLKIRVPDGFTDDVGQEGICVPA